MKFMGRLIQVLALFVGFHLAASIGSAQPEALFSQGAKSFREGKLEEAKKSFLAVETEHPGHTDTLLNLGLIAFKEKRIGAAIGIWRKGLAGEPTSEPLFQAIAFARTKLEKQDMPREFSGWERYRELLLVRLSPALVLLASAFFLLGCGWLWLRWIGARKRAHDEETAGPPPPLGAIVFSILFVFIVGILGSIAIDRNDLRGTVIASKVAVLSAPELEATSLFDLFEGLEVLVRETRDVEGKSWRRVTYPGGLSGWVPAATIFATDDPAERAFENTSSKVNP